MTENQHAIELRELADLTNKLLGGRGVDIDHATAQKSQTWGDSTPNPFMVVPKGHLDFFPKGSVSLAAAPGANQSVLQLRVPLGMDGVIKSIGNWPESGGFVNDSGTIVWRILADGRAVRNFDNIRSIMGQSVGWPVDLAVGIPIFSGQLIEYQVQHLTDAAFDDVLVICQFKGYFFPSQGGGAA